MNPDQLDLARHLFAEATALLEDAHDVAVKGQSPALRLATCRRHAAALRVAAGQLSAFADALAALTARHG